MYASLARDSRALNSGFGRSRLPGWMAR